MGKRRINPGYLSDDEVARDRERTAAVVRSIAINKQVNFGISRRKEIKRGWYTNRLCDSCGTTLQMGSYRCKECNIALCYKCAKEIKQIRRATFLLCPMCNVRL